MHSTENPSSSTLTYMYSLYFNLFCLKRYSTDTGRLSLMYAILDYLHPLNFIMRTRGVSSIGGGNLNSMILPLMKKFSWYRGQTPKEDIL